MVAELTISKQPESKGKKMTITTAAAAAAPPDEFEKMIRDRTEIETNRKEFVAVFLPKLLSYGSAIFKVEHIPGDIKIGELNSLLGTGNIHSNQVIGVKFPYKRDSSMMNARVILKSGTADANKIVRFHGKLAPGINERLNIKPTDIKELEQFLLKNYPNLFRLDRSPPRAHIKSLPTANTTTKPKNQPSQQVQGRKSSPTPKVKGQASFNERIRSMEFRNKWRQISSPDRSPQKLIIDESIPPPSPPIAASNFDDVDSFVPLTIDTLPYAINIVYRLSTENRLVFVTFDKCFTNSKLSLIEVNSRYSTICGPVEEGCIIIKTNLEKLMPDIRTAYGKEFKRLPRAFIITSKGTDKHDLVSKSNQNMVLCGLMTFSCIVMNLKKSTFLMSRNALLRAGAPEANVTLNNQAEFPVNKEFTVRKKMMANLTSPKPPQPTSKQPEKKRATVPNSYPPDEFEKMLKEKVESETNQNEYVSLLLPKLVSCGNVVFKVEHIPGDLVISELNSLLGTTDIQDNQVVGVRYPYKKDKSIMNARVILRSDSPDIGRITKHHGRLAPGINEKLNIKLSDIKGLEQFLTKNYTKLVRLNQSSQNL